MLKKRGITNSQPLGHRKLFAPENIMPKFLPAFPAQEMVQPAFPACKSEVFLISSSFFNLFIHQVPHFFPVTSSKYTADLPHLWPLSQGSPGLTSLLSDQLLLTWV